MNRFFKIILIGFSIVLLAWILPDTYHFITTKKVRYPFIVYSPLLQDFLIQDSKDKNIFYNDTKGNQYTSQQTDSLVPTLYYRQLLTDNRLPDTLMGVAVDQQLIRRTNFFFRHSPRDINTKKVKLYPLLESRPKRIELSMPDDIVRFTDSEIQFVDMESNSINRKKSALFQKVFDQKGVQLPIKAIGGDPNAKKDYDEGYFFTDSQNQLFHLKQMVGQPYLKKIALDPSLKIDQIFITEFPNRSSFAFITDVNHNFYVLTAPSYQLVKTAIPSFNPKEDAILIMGNMFDWNVKINNQHSITNYALSTKDFSLMQTLSTPLQTTKWEEATEYIFPFELKFGSPLNKYFTPYIINLSVLALFLNLFLMFVFVVLKRKKMTSVAIIVSSLCIVVGGLFSFIPLLIYSKL